MRNYSKTVGALAVASFMVGHAGAEIEGQVGVGYSNEYVFRGYDMAEDLIDASVDLGWDMGRFALSAGAWYGAAQDGFDGEELNELRVYAEAATELGAGLSGRVGVIHYDRDSYYIDAYPLENATEVYFGLSYELPFYGISSDLTYYWDVDGDNDGYLELGLGKHVAINDCWSADFGGKLGYLVEQGGFSHATVKAALNYHFSQTATVSGFVSHVWELDELEGSAGSFRSFDGYDESNSLFGGVGLTVSF